MKVYEMDTLKNRDAILEGMCGDLEDVPMDPETERIEEDFLVFPAGTQKEDILYWFDERHSKGVHYLLYGEADGMDYHAFVRLDRMCQECMSHDCAYNAGGVCKLPYITRKAPYISFEYGCKDYIFKEAEN